MASLDPALGAQIFEIDPYRVRRTRRHGLEVAVGKPHAESLDDDVRRRDVRERHTPVPDFDRIDDLQLPCGINAAAEAVEAGKVVHPQADRLSPFRRQLARHTPTHADIAEIIDDRAEDVPGARQCSPAYDRFSPAPLFRDVCAAGRATRQRRQHQKGPWHREHDQIRTDVRQPPQVHPERGEILRRPALLLRGFIRSGISPLTWSISFSKYFFSRSVRS